MNSPERIQFGLTRRDMETIQRILSQYPEVAEVRIFGSRATGKFHAGSDIDIAVMNPGVSDVVIHRIEQDFEDSSLPYFVDVVNFPALQHKGFRSHIERFGVVCYEHAAIGL